MHKDTIMQEAIDANANMIVPFYLMCAYAYYEKDEPIASDAFFDNLAKVYLKKYDELRVFVGYLSDTRSERPIQHTIDNHT